MSTTTTNSTLLNVNVIAAFGAAATNTSAAAATTKAVQLPPPDLVAPGAGERIAMYLPGIQGFNGQRFATDAEMYLAAARRGGRSAPAGPGSGSNAAGDAGDGDGDDPRKLIGNEIIAEIYRCLCATEGPGRRAAPGPQDFQKVRAALRSDDPRLRETTVAQFHTILGIIFHDFDNGIPASFGPAIAELVGPLLRDPRPKTRETAARLFASSAAATGYLADLLALLKDSNPQVQTAAARAVATHAAKSRVLPSELIPLLSDSSAAIRMAALRAVTALELTLEGAKEILPRLQEIAQRDPSPGCRGTAIELMGRLGVERSTVEQLLIEQIRLGKDFPFSHETVVVLSMVMPFADSPAVAEAIAAQLQQKNRFLPTALRVAYITALGRMPAHAPIVVPALAAQLELKAFTYWRAREAAAKALGRLGPASVEALPQLRSLAEHGDVAAVRSAAAKAAAQISGEVKDLN